MNRPLVEQHPLGFFLPEGTQLLMFPTTASAMVDALLLPEYPE